MHPHIVTPRSRIWIWKRSSGVHVVRSDARRISSSCLIGVDMETKSIESDRQLLETMRGV
jgi:hypothetical protein